MKMTIRKATLVLLAGLLVLSGCDIFDKNGYPRDSITGASIGHPIPVTVNGTPNVTISSNVTINGNVNATIVGQPISVTTSNTTSSINATIWAMSTNGSPMRFNMNPDGQLVVNNEVVLQEIAEHGQLETHNASSFHVMGRRAGFNSTSDLQDVKEFNATTEGLFPTLNSSQALEVVSSSASDTANGTGARTVEVTYIDSGNNLVNSGNITLNGTTPVAVNFTANFIISMEVSSIGSSETSVGNIVLRVVSGAVTQEQISAGGNRSLSAHFMVPAGYTGYLVSWEGSAVSTGGSTITQDMRIRATVDDEGRYSSVYHFLDNMFLASGVTSSQISLPYIKLPQLTKIKVSTISSSLATTARADASYCLYIVQN